jgi:hypothetical protein
MLDDDTRRARIAEYIDRRVIEIGRRDFWERNSSHKRVELLIRMIEEAEKEVGRGKS